jgi:hypothetical protein
MNLCYPANRQGSDLDKSETSEVPGFADVYVTLVGEQDVWFALQCMPIHSPYAST